jgi:hypothetical protein
VKPFIRRPGAGRLVCCLLLAVAPGCGGKADGPAPAVVARQAPSTPGEIELSDPKVTLVEPTLVQFEVKYRFTRGRPDRYYACDISFPGTPNHGVRQMEAWELKPQGVIRDRIVLSQPGAKSFAIQMSESLSPREAYKKNSNVVSGTIR